MALKPEPVDAVELMDRSALRAVQDKTGMPDWLQSRDEGAAALLVDLRAGGAGHLEQIIEGAAACLQAAGPDLPVSFTRDREEIDRLWAVRKGLFPAVGAVRTPGTTVVIEDVAFPIERLASATLELQGLFRKHGYHRALIFGHALEGNLHFVFTQDFGTESEVARYRTLMDDVAVMVTERYGGSLKAEHGTGRNMAPFVEMEWGGDAYGLMWEIKQLLDPDNLLNPGVLLNRDPLLHLKNLKPLPEADPAIDRCIECGFCEPVCPSRDLTLTPRQRIVSLREMARLRRSEKEPERLAEFERDFQYQGMDSCAADGLCAGRCPVGIDTGAMIRRLRAEHTGPVGRAVAGLIRNSFGPVTAVARLGLGSAAAMGDKVVRKGMALLHDGPKVAAPPLPGPAQPLNLNGTEISGANGRVVYFPSCVTRTFESAQGKEARALHNVMLSLCRKAGFAVEFPQRPDGLCCGMPYHSKGYREQAEKAARDLQRALWQASNGGEYPIVCDTSPCTLRLIEELSVPLKLFEPAGFIHRYLMPHLQVKQRVPSVALHLTCSSRRMGLDAVISELAAQCAEQVFQPEEEGCCGFAGDKGFTVPELNAAALRRLREQLPGDCREGYSNSLTCEVGLTHHSGIPYRSIAYLVDECCGQVER